MDLFVAVHNDRHIDTGVYVFSSEAAAVAWATKTAHALDRHGVMREIAFEEERTGKPHPDWGLTPEMKKSGWVFRAVYGVEGDSIVVRRVVLDAQVGR